VRAKITLVDRAPLRLGQRVEVAIAR